MKGSITFPKAKTSWRHLNLDNFETKNKILDF